MVRVFAISVQLVNGAIDLCHRITVPTFPESVSRPLVLPVQIVVPPVTVPPTVAREIATVVEVENTSPQAPLSTTALNCVAWVNTPEV